MTESTSPTAAPASHETHVTRNDEKGRYEITLDQTPAGYTAFEPDSLGRLVFPHTVIDPAFKGHGLGTILVSEALADVARRGEVVVPRCPFVVKYLKEHDVAGLTVAWPNAQQAGDAATPGETPA